MRSRGDGRWCDGNMDRMETMPPLTRFCTVGISRHQAKGRKGVTYFFGQMDDRRLGRHNERHRLTVRRAWRSTVFGGRETPILERLN